MFVSAGCVLPASPSPFYVSVEAALLIKNLQLLSRCEMCDKNKIALLPSAPGQYAGHLTAMAKRSGIPRPVQGQFNNRCSGRKEALLLGDLGIQPSNRTVQIISPNSSLLLFTDKTKIVYHVYKAV